MQWPAVIQALDERVLATAHGQPALLVPLFVAITVIGGGWGLIALLPFALRAATRTVTLWLFLAVGVTSTGVALLKTVVGRVRPCNALGWCNAVDVRPPSDFSFPSGHAAGSFAFAAFVAWVAPRWAAPAFLWAVLVGWSRCVLGVHYPSDVLAGALLGTVLGVVFARVWERRSTRAAEPVAE